MELHAAQPPVACLVGPTAAGKTAAALALAGELSGSGAGGLPIEVISMDSALVYRGMDIGTAKPTAAERALLPHHLVDILDPTEAYSAARFAADARRLVAEIRSRGREPLVVGGTMLYHKALAEGLSAIPASDPALRAELDAEGARRGWPALHAELARVDAPTAARLAPNDAQRIQRALEVWRGSGVPLSQWQQRPPAQPGLALHVVSLEPAGEDGRAWLHRRIAQRVDAMLAAGLLDEVRALRARGDLHERLPALRAVGYRQAWQALQHGEPVTTAALRDAAVAATRQLAKRQLTWLRSLAQRQVVAADAPDAPARAVAALRQALRA